MNDNSHEQLGAADMGAADTRRDGRIHSGQPASDWRGGGTLGDVYRLIGRVLKAQPYRRLSKGLSKGQRGIVRRFLGKITALSGAQLTRLGSAG
ncbi:MAG TPA: hypothetical protein VKJ01_25455 [Candidatus Solibacter sp.]|jgi:hypothetical protein|nr:hypothetical protein [Candidatus Solibacter sp.]